MGKLDRSVRRISGTNKVRRNLRQYGVEIGKALQALTVETGKRVAETATRALETGADRAPDPDTFELARSVRLVIEKHYVAIGTAVKHGFFQEFGTHDVKAHPWLYPSLARNKAKHMEKLKELHAKAMNSLDTSEGD